MGTKHGGVGQTGLERVQAAMEVWRKRRGERIPVAIWQAAALEGKKKDALIERTLHRGPHALTGTWALNTQRLPLNL